MVAVPTASSCWSVCPQWAAGEEGGTERKEAGSARREQASTAGSAASKPLVGPSPGTWTQQLGWGPTLAVCNELPGDMDQLVRGAQ